VAWLLRCQIFSLQGNSPMSIMLSMIHWLCIYPLTSNSSSPEGKSHLKPSTDQKVVLWLQILKLIILGSKYRGLYAHLSPSVFLYGAVFSVKCEFIHKAPLDSSFISDASWSTPEQRFCVQISSPKIELRSVWRAHEASRQAADQFGAPHH